jgi:hypothetical protein
LKKILFSLNSFKDDNMINTDKRPRKWAAIFFLFTVFVACEKPEESIGIDLQPEDDIFNISGVDTFTVSAISLPEDSLRTDGPATGMVGAYIDPVFGLTKASHYTELRLITSNPIFHGDGSSIENLIIDSLVLNLAYDVNEDVPVYGSTGKQYFQVFEVIDSLDVDEEYYSNQSLNILEEDLVLEGENLISPNYRDSSVVGGETFRPALRIPLKPDLGERIFEAGEGDGLSATEFLEVIKGIKITVDENAGGVNLSNTGILSFNSFAGLSRLELYYRDTGVDPDSTLFYDFEIRGSTGKFNSFEHDFVNGGEPSLIRQVVSGIDSPIQDRIYAQAAGGVKIRVDLPHIADLRKIEGLAVAKAQLILPLKSTDGNRFPPPLNMIVFGLDENGDAFFINDFLDNQSDGALNSNQGQYGFYITRYLQQVLNGERDFYGLEIVVERATTTANRVVLAGPPAPGEAVTSDDLRLDIVFTNY